MLLPLVLASMLSVGGGQGDYEVVRTWVERVRLHQPGIVDEPLRQIAATSAKDFEIIRRGLRDAVKGEPVPARNDIARRGALAHTDIALLLPERAAEYLDLGLGEERFFFDEFEKPRVSYRKEAGAVLSLDGEYVGTTVETAHWEMARRLLDGVYQARTDEFVRLWYRAVAAHFEARNRLGSARNHLAQALRVLPDDPMILLYAGAMHEVYGSDRAQSVLNARLARTGPRTASAVDEWREAERSFARAVNSGGPPEARLRRARVLGKLARHAEAAVLLRGLEPELAEPRLKYLAALFLGTEESALGRTDRARAAFERAAALYPAAQSPLMGLAGLFVSTGNRGDALAVLDRIAALPPERSREDPWSRYFRSFASNADEQMAATRAWLSSARKPQ